MKISVLSFWAGHVETDEGDIYEGLLAKSGENGTLIRTNQGLPLLCPISKLVSISED